MIIRNENEHSIRKQVNNCIIMGKGLFPYNLNLGSRILSIDLSDDNAEKNNDLAVREALLQVPQVKYISSTLFLRNSVTRKILIEYEYLGQAYETEVELYG